MARIKFSGLIQSVKGSIGASVIQGNGANVIVRSKRGAKQKTTTLTQKNKGAIRSNASNWRLLTSTQRQGWEDAAVNFAQGNVFGNDKKYSGYALYSKLNASLRLNLGTTINNPPTPQVVTDIGYISITEDAYTDWKLNWQFFLGTGNAIMVYASPVVSMGRAYKDSIMRVIKTISDTGVDNEQVGDAYVSYYPWQPTSGRVWFKAVVINTVTGQQGSPRVVAVDFNQLSSGPLVIYEARLAALGLPALSPGVEILYQNFFNSLQAGSNNFSKIKRLYWLGAEDYRQALVSLVNPSSAPASPIGGIESTFLVYKGFFPPTTAQYIDSNYNPTVDTGTYTLNSAGFSVYSRTNIDTNALDIYGLIVSPANFGDLREGGRTYMAMNDAYTFGAGLVVADSLGLYTFIRTSSTSVSIYKRGVLVGTKSVTSTSIPNANIKFNGKRNLLCMVVHSGTLNAAELEASVTAFATAIGSNV